MHKNIIYLHTFLKNIYIRNFLYKKEIYILGTYYYHLFEMQFINLPRFVLKRFKKCGKQYNPTCQFEKSLWFIFEFVWHGETKDWRELCSFVCSWEHNLYDSRISRYSEKSRFLCGSLCLQITCYWNFQVCIHNGLCIHSFGILFLGNFKWFLGLFLFSNPSPLAEMRSTWRTSFSGQIQGLWAQLGLKEARKLMEV